jgi:DNA-binding FadR family transcriptional regulator
MVKKQAQGKLDARIAQGIGERILGGEFAPGTLLPNEAEWGRIYGASRTAVREAIKALSAKGLIASRPKVGSRVEPKSRWNLLDRDVLAWHRTAIDTGIPPRSGTGDCGARCAQTHDETDRQIGGRTR